MPEYVEWWSDSNRVIGIVEKEFAHDYGLKHPVIHVWAITPQHELIVQKRSPRVRLFPGKFDSSAGGHIGAGEDPWVAAQRELTEELSITGTLHFLGTLTAYVKEHDYIIHDYTYFYYVKTNQRPRPQRGELAGTVRVPLSKLAAFLSTHQCGTNFTLGWKKFGKKVQQTLGVKS